MSAPFQQDAKTLQAVADASHALTAWGEKLRAKVEGESSASWDVADCLVEGVANFDEDKAFSTALKVTTLKEKALYQRFQIAKKFPVSTRVENASYSHHRAVVGKKYPLKEALRYLEAAVADRLSERDFIARLKKDKSAPKPEAEQPTTKRLSIVLSAETHALILAYAKARGEKPGELASGILGVRVAELAPEWTAFIERQAESEAKEKAAAEEKREAAKAARLAEAERAQAQKTVEAYAKVEAEETYEDVLIAVEAAQFAKRITPTQGDKIIAAARKVRLTRLKMATFEDLAKPVVRDLAAEKLVGEFLDSEKAVAA